MPRLVLAGQFSVAVNTLGHFRSVNCFYFLKVFKTKLAALAAISGLLVAAKRTSVAMRRSVDMHHAGPQTRSNSFCSLRISGLHIGGKAVSRVIRHCDGFFFAVERNNREN